MPSGQFRLIPIKDIRTNRDERQRRELTGIEELAASIKANGLINAILVQRETLTIVAGERRLEACRSLGWESIPAQFEDELDPKQLAILELEENVRRVDLSWQDRVRAVLGYHKAQQALSEDWTVESTAQALNFSLAYIAEQLRVAEELVEGNPLVLNAPKLSTAANITRRVNERRGEALLESLRLSVGAPVEVKPKDPDVILNADFIEWAPNYSGPRFNFIHCDFPYGINANKFNQGGAATHGGYEDSPDVYFSLLSVLADNLSHIAAPTCHIMFWFSMHFYQDTLDFFEAKTPFKIDPFPLIWIKSDNSGILPDPERGPRRIYETAFFGALGDRKIIGAKSNAFSAPSVKDIHMSIKSPEMLEHFFKMFVDESTRLLDPTCGSGGAIRVAHKLGAETVLGLERDPTFAADAQVKFNKEAKKNESR